MLNTVSRFLLNPAPMRSLAIRGIRKLELGRYEDRLRVGAVDRPHYGYCLYHSAQLAVRLGHKRISVLEFGVAGGRGLVNLEYHAREISKVLPIEIDIYGFDTGQGLPKTEDYRDLPYHWKEGFFKMDVSKLQSRLQKAKLILGDVRKTTSRFFAEYKPAPVAAIMFDLDFYSSTVGAFGIFDGAPDFLLPRIYCYFDDVTGTETELYNDHTGVRLAINEFNQRNEKKKLGAAYHLTCSRLVESWHHQIMVYHDFSHPRYNEFISEKDQQIRLQS